MFPVGLPIPGITNGVEADPKEARHKVQTAWQLAKEIEPMSLANMREHGVRFVEATCEVCKHEAAISVDNLPGDIYVPHVALKLRCSACGSKKITTWPDWTHHKAYGRSGYTTARNPGS